VKEKTPKTVRKRERNTETLSLSTPAADATNKGKTEHHDLGVILSSFSFSFFLFFFVLLFPFPFPFLSALQRSHQARGIEVDWITRATLGIVLVPRPVEGPNLPQLARVTGAAVDPGVACRDNGEGREEGGRKRRRERRKRTVIQFRVDNDQLSYQFKNTRAVAIQFKYVFPYVVAHPDFFPFSFPLFFQFFFPSFFAFFSPFFSFLSPISTL
jgi:hypothetical protein